MNLILLQPDEPDDTGRVVLTDRRAVHILKVLKPEVGQTLRIGILNGPKGTGTVLSQSESEVTLQIELDDTLPERPRIDLALALPRPQCMKRLWPQLAALGIGHLALINANRVERYYFDYHIIREEGWDPLLQEGLEQAVDTLLPKVTIHKRFKKFINEEIDDLFPDHLRLLADPTGPDLSAQPASAQRILLAIGPEGGWNDFELEHFAVKSFSCFNLGSRILRTDTACVAALTQVSLSCRANTSR